jgi:hypothetical protein
MKRFALTACYNRTFKHQNHSDPKDLRALDVKAHGKFPSFNPRSFARFQRAPRITPDTEHLPPFMNCPDVYSTAKEARIMTRTTKANTILGAIIVVLLALAGGYYMSGPSVDTAQAPQPVTDQTSTGSIGR